MLLALEGEGGTQEGVIVFLLTPFVKWCCQVYNEATSLLSQHAWAAQERRQKAWEITWELVPKCVAILGPLLEQQGRTNLERS